jgi:hypothetical protein
MNEIESPEERLEHLRYMLKHILYCATDVPDGELIAMVRYMRDAKDEAEAEVRRLQAVLRGPSVD